MIEFFSVDFLNTLRDRLLPGLWPLLLAFVICVAATPLMIRLSRRTGLIAGSVKTSNAEQAQSLKGANDTFARIGTADACLFVYTPPSAQYGAPMAGATWEWSGYTGAGANGSRISRWFDPNTKKDMFEVESAYGQSVVAADMGIFLADVDAA